MWIVLYVATLATLSAFGLAPSLVPVRTDDDRTPYVD